MEAFQREVVEMCPNLGETRNLGRSRPLDNHHARDVGFAVVGDPEEGTITVLKPDFGAAFDTSCVQHGLVIHPCGGACTRYCVSARLLTPWYNLIMVGRKTPPASDPVAKPSRCNPPTGGV